MKTLNQQQIERVSGGEQYFVFTHRIDITGVPESALADFYSSNQDKLTSMTMKEIINSLYDLCPKSGSIMIKDELISVSLINVDNV